MGWGARKIEEWLGVSDNTVLRAINEPTPEELKQFEAEFELAIKDMKCQGRALVQKRILELVPKERRLDQLVKAGEYLEGKGGTQVAVGVSVPVTIENPEVNYDRLAEKVIGLVERLKSAGARENSEGSGGAREGGSGGGNQESKPGLPFLCEEVLPNA
jgi:hypothetical protein